MIIMKVNFVEITKDPSNNEIKFLYELLASRKYSISHQEMPDYDNHQEFVRNNPYIYWAIIYYKDIKVGSLYINDDNSLGLHILEDYHNLGEVIISNIESILKPQDEIKSKRSKEFSFNIPPNDSFMRDLLVKCGYSIKQVSYQKEK